MEIHSGDVVLMRITCSFSFSGDQQVEIHPGNLVRVGRKSCGPRMRNVCGEGRAAVILCLTTQTHDGPAPPGSAEKHPDQGEIA